MADLIFCSGVESESRNEWLFTSGQWIWLICNEMFVENLKRASVLI
jgi:hypothetical protein